MSEEKKTSQKMQDEMMLTVDHKRVQHEQNYRRAAAFLKWKLGPAYDEADRFLRGSRMDWPSLFVEFAEKVEEDLLKRMRYIEELHFKDIQLKAMIGPMQLKPEDFFIGKSYPPQEEEKPNGK